MLADGRALVSRQANIFAQPPFSANFTQFPSLATLERYLRLMLSAFSTAKIFPRLEHELADCKTR